MGLTISHGAWDGGYASFMVWRQEIASLEGIPLMMMEGYYGFGVVDYNRLIKGALSESGFSSYLADVFQRDYLDHLPLKWSNFRRNALHKLLYHSDCGGTLNWRGLKGIYMRLEYLMEKREMSDFCKQKTRQFIEGAKKAYEAQESLRFT